MKYYIMTNYIREAKIIQCTINKAILNNLYKSIIIGIFFVWLSLVVIRIPIYTVKAIQDKSSYINMTEESKKVKIYKSVYKDFQKIEKELPDDVMALYISDDSWEYFLLRYLLYPKRIINFKSPLFDHSINEYKYLIVNNSKSIPKYFKGKLIVLN